MITNICKSKHISLLIIKKVNFKVYFRRVEHIKANGLVYNHLHENQAGFFRRIQKIMDCK